jgi:hypothetical protein
MIVKFFLEPLFWFFDPNLEPPKHAVASGQAAAASSNFIANFRDYVHLQSSAAAERQLLRHSS